jgi:hypothetical protein
VVTGGAGLATAAVVAVSAYAVLPDPATGRETMDSTVANRGGSVVTEFPAPPFTCGVAFPPPASIGTKYVKLTQKTMAESPDGWVGSLQSQITNPFDKRLVGGRPPRELAVVQENKVVGHASVSFTGGLVEIPPGQTHISTVRIDIRSCDSERLPVGSYLLYEDLTDTGKSTDAGMVLQSPLGRIDLR